MTEVREPEPGLADGTTRAGARALNGARAEPPQATQRASHSPLTGELLGHVPLVGPAGIDAAVQSAREAQPAWAAQSPRQRAAVLAQFRDALVADADAVAHLIMMEQGKPEIEALSMEIMSLLSNLKWLLEEGVEQLAPQSTPIAHPLFSAKQAFVAWEPLGVVAILAPWNYPFVIPTVQALTALLAGNAVVLKPSPFVPLIGQKIAELMRGTDLPTGLLHVIHVADADAPHLTSHPDIDKIIFTGSVETGRRVMASAAEGPTPVLLELGGKDAAIVAPDADLPRAVAGIVWFAMANGGQTCAAVERAYVHADVYDRFVAEAVALVETLQAGDPRQAGVNVGPLTNERQLKIVEAHVAEAVEQGARVLVGGHRLRGEGFFYAPTLLVDVTPEMRIMAEETFGPVLPIVRVASMDEAVEQANRTIYGLTASVWTASDSLGRELARRLRAGSVNVNDHAFHYAEPRAAWGGVGHSGFGRTNGVFGLREMVNIKYVSLDMRRGVLDPWWYPYDEKTHHFLRNAMRLLYGPAPRRPWALLSLLLNPRTWQRVSVARFLAHFRKWL